MSSAQEEELKRTREELEAYKQQAEEAISAARTLPLLDALPNSLLSNSFRFLLVSKMDSSPCKDKCTRGLEVSKAQEEAEAHKKQAAEVVSAARNFAELRGFQDLKVF